MDTRKPPFWDHFISVLSSKRGVISGFGLGVLAFLVVVSCLVSINTPPSSSPSLFSWFSSVSDGVSRSGLKKSVGLWLGNEGDAATEKTHDGNSSDSYFIAKESSLEEKTHEGNPRKSNITAKEPDLEKTHVGNSTVDTQDSSNQLKSGPLERNHVGNPSNGSFTGNNGRGGSFVAPVLSEINAATPHGGSPVVGEAHLGNTSKDEKKDEEGVKDSGRSRVHVGGKNASHGSDEGRARERIQDGESKNNGSGSVRKCDIFNGRWVRDQHKPYYPAGSCPYIDTDFDCHKNGRPDDGFLRWRWQPYGCDIPRLNATNFLERLRGKRLIFVGDSLNRNMWESLVCILRHSIKHKNRVYEASGRREFKTSGYYAFRFEDYNCSVDFVRSTFLVREIYYKNSNGSDDEKLRLDLLDETSSAYREAEIIVFNTGHWWTHEKTSRGIEYYQEGNYVYPVLKAMEAYKKALNTWARWVDNNINVNKTRVVFRGYSLTHFRGGQWNSGGQCHKETEPILNESFLAKYPSKMRALDQVLVHMKTPVIYLNISRLTDYRKDGHPSIYRKMYKTVEEQIAAEKSQDCSHWCLPGIPDTWNELLYASLLMDGQGSWKR